MRLIRLLLFVTLLCSVSFSRQSRFVSVAGKEIIAPDGTSLMLRGINLGNWLVPEGYMFKFERAASPRLINEVFAELLGPDGAHAFWKTFRDRYITQDDIQLIKKLGLNSIRIPFNYRLFMSDDDPERLAGPGFEMLERVIGWCREAGLYVVLDMHCAPGGQTGDNIDDSYAYPFLFESPQDQQRTIALWVRLAERYADDPTVIGYDLLNEPIPHFFDQNKFNPLLEPLYRRIVNAMRQVDTNHLIFLGGAQWDSNFKVFGPPFDDKLVYTFHKYWTDTTQSVIQEYLDFREQHDVPIWMGESGENTDEWITSFRRLLERKSIGWCFWPYKKLDATSCILSIPQPEGYDEIIGYANKPRTTFEEIRTARPPLEKVRKIFTDFLEAVRLKNCRINENYIRALGLKFE